MRWKMDLITGNANKLYLWGGDTEKLSIKINHHHTLEKEQLGVGWCSLLSVMLALPLCNPADSRLSPHKWEKNPMARVANINVPVCPKHLFHWATWALHKKNYSAWIFKFFYEGIAHVFFYIAFVSFESTSQLKSVMSRTVAISFFRAPKADVMSFSFLLDLSFEYWSFYRGQFPCHPSISLSVLVLVRI